MRHNVIEKILSGTLTMCERVRDDDRCAETSARNDENNKRSKHYDHRDERNNTQGQY